MSEVTPTTYGPRPQTQPSRGRRLAGLLIPPFILGGILTGVWYYASYVWLQGRRRVLLAPPHKVLTKGFGDWEHLREILAGLRKPQQGRVLLGGEEDSEDEDEAMRNALHARVEALRAARLALQTGGLGAQGVEILAEQLDGDLRAHAGEHVVDAMRDRLADRHGRGQVDQPRADVGQDRGPRPLE